MNNKMKKTLWLLLLALTLLFLVACGNKNETVKNAVISDDEVNRVASQLYCPICQNVPLDVCPSKACADWRELIREQLSEGKSDEEIKQYFSEQYGWNALSMPPRVGFNWILYALPPLLIIGGGLFVLLTFRNRKKSKKIENNSPRNENTADLTEYISRIERDLKDENHDS
jgi:cytochrome c-type biogenesis protein CcmH